MSKRIGKYRVSKRESSISAVDGATVTGDLSGITNFTSAAATTTGVVTAGTNIQAGTDAQDVVIQQFDGTEVARVHDGGVTPTNTGTSTSLSAGTGFGYRRRVITVDSSNDNNVLTLTAADSGAIIYVFATNALNINLPVVGTEIGQFFTIILGDKDNKAFTVKTSGQDGNDNIILQNTLTVADNSAGTTADLGGSDHDILTIDNMLEGSRIDLLNFVGGAAEMWLANVISTDTQAGTIA